MDLETIVQFQSFLIDLSANVGIACLTHEYSSKYNLDTDYDRMLFKADFDKYMQELSPATHLGIDFGHEAITLLNIQQRTSRI